MTLCQAARGMKRTVFDAPYTGWPTAVLQHCIFCSPRALAGAGYPTPLQANPQIGSGGVAAAHWSWLTAWARARLPG
eukprot:1157983-Pelagomonas_calceolata.AAC.7